jgi:hypothetical protein
VLGDGLGGEQGAREKRVLRACARVRAVRRLVLPFSLDIVAEEEGSAQTGAVVNTPHAFLSPALNFFCRSGRHGKNWSSCILNPYPVMIAPSHVDSRCTFGLSIYLSITRSFYLSVSVSRSHARTHTPARTHAHMHARRHARTHACARAHTHTQIHTHTGARAHTHCLFHTHIRTQRFRCLCAKRMILLSLNPIPNPQTLDPNP